VCTTCTINYHDSHAHSHEWHEPFTQLVAFGWVGSVGFESSRSGSWYAASAKPVCMFWFSYRWDACERWSVFGYRCDSCELEALDYSG
jgi:hypothetical protein